MRSLISIACTAAALAAIMVIAGCDSDTVSRTESLNTTFGPAPLPTTYRVGPPTSIDPGPREHVIIGAG